MSKRTVNNEISDLTNNPISYTTENVALDVPSKKAKLTEKIEEAISRGLTRQKIIKKQKISKFSSNSKKKQKY